MKTILITAGQSGCGVSTVASALCQALAGRNRRVLLCEVGAGLREQNRILKVAEDPLFDLGDVLEGRSAPEEAIIPIGRRGFSLLQAASAIDWLPNTVGLQSLQLSLHEHYDYLVLDCPCGAGELQRRCAPVVDTLILVSCLTDSAIRAASKVGAWWEGLGVRRQRTVFNYVGNRLPKGFGYPHLDAALDTIGAQLLGIIPQCAVVTDSAAVHNIAARLDGETRPLLPVYLK